jgi:hypothetical protein
MTMERAQVEEWDAQRDERRNARDRCVALLRKTNALLVGLRRALGHDHRDEARWAAWGVTPGEAMALRVKLRAIADVLHVERATARGRVHGGRRFASLEEQRKWLTENARRREYAEEFVTEVGLSALP